MSRLESGGLIGRIEAEIAADEALQQGYAADHAEYVEERWSLLTSRERTTIAGTSIAAVLRERGVGGIVPRTVPSGERRWRNVKCLHLHWAHHLVALDRGAAGTTVGRLVAARSSLPSPESSLDGCTSLTG